MAKTAVEGRRADPGDRPGLRRRLGRAVALLGRAGKRMSDEDGFMMAGHLSFTALLALFPFLIFLTSLASFLGTQADLERIVALMFDSMPDEVAATLEPAVAEVVVGRRAGFLGFSVLMMLWAASSGIEAIRLAFNRAYRVSRFRPFWMRRLQTFLFVMLAILLVPAMSVLVVFGPILWNLVTYWIDLGFAYRLVWTVARNVVAIAILFLTLVVLHRWLPNRRHHVRDILPGVVFTVLALMVAGTGFSTYLASFASYSVTYGSMASVVISLIFFYITSIILVFGAYVNAGVLGIGRG